MLIVGENGEGLTLKSDNINVSLKPEAAILKVGIFSITRDMLSTPEV